MFGEDAVRFARAAVESEVRGASAPDRPADPRFSEMAGAFVTISEYPSHDLRGCIGYPYPVLPLADALEKYAAEHDGRFPAEEGIAGLKTLLEAGLIAPSALICPGTEDEAAADTESFTFDNCSYVYFGGFNRKSNPKLPLVIDWPFNHADAVNVILVDGSVETLELENPENCRRVVSYLHTRYHYTEPEFKQLMQKAAALDQQFELD